MRHRRTEHRDHRTLRGRRDHRAPRDQRPPRDHRCLRGRRDDRARLDHRGRRAHHALGARVLRACHRLLPLVVAVFLVGCNYSFRAGSFPPPHIQTISIEPFENETARFELSGELYDQLLRNLPGALGIRTAGADVADAVVRGSINRYDVVAPNYRSGAAGQPAEVLQRQVNISVSVQIVDLVENVILWESNSVTALGEFPEGSPEETGRRRAIELLVQEIVDGAQSNW